MKPQCRNIIEFVSSHTPECVGGFPWGPAGCCCCHSLWFQVLNPERGFILPTVNRRRCGVSGDSGGWRRPHNDKWGLCVFMQMRGKRHANEPFHGSKTSSAPRLICIKLQRRDSSRHSRSQSQLTFIRSLTFTRSPYDVPLYVLVFLSYLSWEFTQPRFSSADKHDFAPH